MKKNIILIISAMLITIIVASCGGAPPFIARSMTAPPLKYCNDATGHKIGAAPFVLGGTCTCTPTEKHFSRCLSENTISNTMTYAQFLELYTSKGIKTDLDHKGCNNQCQWGPHLVFGGKCMATPTPGTLNYERVVSGIQTLTMDEVKYGSQN